MQSEPIEVTGEMWDFLVKRIETLESQIGGAAKGELVIKGAEVAKPGKQTSRGTRLTPGWRPSNETIQAMFDRFPHITKDEWVATTEAFIDYWIGVPGQRGTKLDWEATWRNWVRREFNQAHYRARSKMAPPTHSKVDQKVADLQAMKDPT